MQRTAIYQDEEFEIRPLDISEAPALLEAVRSSRHEIGLWETWCNDNFSLDEASMFLQFECLARHRLMYHGEPRDAKIFSLIPKDMNK